jgi:hypothetical protein
MARNPIVTSLVSLVAGFLFVSSAECQEEADAAPSDHFQADEPTKTSPEFENYKQIQQRPIGLRYKTGGTGYLYVRTAPKDALMNLFPPNSKKPLSLHPWKTEKVPSGCMKAVVRAVGFRDATGIICIAKNEVTRIDVVLERPPDMLGRITILSEPEESEVQVDKKPVGKTPLTVTVLKGEHLVLVAYDRFFCEKKVFVSGGEVVVLKAKLGRGAMDCGTVTQE